MGRTVRLAAVLGAGAAVLACCCGVAAADAGDGSAPGPAATKADAARSERASAVREAPRTGHRAAVVRPAQATRPTAPAASRRASATAVAPAAAQRGVLSLFDNRTPVVRPVVAGQSGPVLTGRLEATDPDDDRLSYRVTAEPQHGSVVVGADGSFTYTADAAVAATGVTDSFTVAVSDADNGLHVHGLLGLLNLLTFGLIGSSGHVTTASVGISVAPFGPANRAPTATGTAGGADPVTGVVLGAVVGTDPDGDVLSYATTAAPAKGSVLLDAAAGTFSYTPTSAARQTAAAPGAVPADRLDGFTVTVSDGRGGSAVVTVAVPVAPAVTEPPVVPPGSLAAFPGAEGFGASATGGRDGRVIYVTTLAADGPGSLQWAIDQPGARYILFTVSGLIDTQIHLTNGDVTIAGQTSPGGITVRGFVTDETPFQDQDVRAPSDFAENWILQHIRIRPGAGGPSDDGLRLRYTRNAIVDHVSIGNATDEAIEISYSHDITVQNTIIAETVGGHSFYGGVLMNYSNPANGFALDNIALHHNVFNRIEGRLPEGSRESAAAANSTMNLELSNNLYWDPRFFIALGANTGVVTGPGGEPYPIHWNINAVNNFFRVGADFPYGMFDDQIMRDPVNRLFVSGNQMSRYPTRSDYELFYCCNDYPAVTDPATEAQRAQKLSARHPFPTITYTPTALLRTVLLNTAGAWPRDPMDRRLLGSVATDTIATAPTDTNPAGDALLPAFAGAAPAAPVDTDLDGMPDAWEIARGLNPNVANANARTLSSAGYTDLEVYLQQLSAARVTGWA